VASAKAEIEVEGKKIRVSNLDKVLFPKNQFSKGQVIDYYIRISKFLLPHLKNRPLTLKRFPEGIHGEFFYEKNAPSHTPEWISTARVARKDGSKIDFILINDLPSLVWSANLANIELHTFLSCAPKIERPTMMVFDLDPGPPADVIQCCQVALWLRETLSEFKLESFIKFSGSKGLQLYLPLNTPITYETTQPFAKALAELMERQHPDSVVSAMSKDLREGKVFIDWSQNSPHKSTVCVYSLRAKRETPTVSMPMAWDEIEEAVKTKDAEMFSFDPDAAIARVEEKGDLFEPVLKLKQTLSRAFLAKLKKATEANGLVDLKEKPEAKARKGTGMAAYEAKRDFSKTAEPPPAIEQKADSKERMFVIQKHQARNLHYDFRLEFDGVLKSWAVPKGPPYERGEKRLAMQVEDHPLSYARFEGTIPKGQYGGGTVMVWDIGTYTIADGSFESGKLHFALEGRKLKGEWILVRSRIEDRNGVKRSWFLIKGGAGMKPPGAKRDDSSAITGRSMAKIALENDAQWSTSR